MYRLGQQSTLGAETSHHILYNYIYVLWFMSGIYSSHVLVCGMCLGRTLPPRVL